MKSGIHIAALAIGLALFGAVGSSLAATSVTSVLSSSVDALTVAGYSNTGSGSTLQAKNLDWWSGSGYGLKSTAGESNPEHAVDNNGYKESLLLNFGTSTQLDSVKIGWNGGNDSDITVLAWNPAAYMNALIDPATIAAPSLVGKTYADLLGLGWMLVGNYANLAAGVAKAVNGGDQPVSSSYWLVMSYNNLGGGVSASTASDSTAGNFVADGTPDYGKFYSVAYSAGTTTENDVSEPSSALLLGAALFGMVGWRNRRLAVR